MPATRSFDDHGALLSEFGGLCLVRCPRCGGLARAAAEPAAPGTPAATHSRVSCAACGFAQVQRQGAERLWLGPVEQVVSKHCARCGHKLSRSQTLEAMPTTQRVRVRCPECGKTNLVAPTLFPVQRPAHDPLVGLPLWLQTPCCGEVLWAYNPRHLQFLRDYVGASLRRRQPGRNQSLASRLPQWVKSAKNRDEVLRALEKLTATLPPETPETPETVN